MNLVLVQKSTLLALAFTFVSATAAAQNKDAVKSASASYTATGQALMKSLKAGKPNVQEVEKSVDTLIKEAQVVMKEYAVKFPESKKLVEHLSKEISAIKAAKFDVIERDYHDAEKLTKDVVGLDLKDEKNEKFLDPCHVLVHPIMVLAAVKEGKFKEAAEELNEGMEQMKASEKELTK